MTLTTSPRSFLPSLTLGRQGVRGKDDEGDDKGDNEGDNEGDDGPGGMGTGCPVAEQGKWNAASR
jgi:hypothetical protein